MRNAGSFRAVVGDAAGSFWDPHFGVLLGYRVVRRVYCRAPRFGPAADVGPFGLSWTRSGVLWGGSVCRRTRAGQLGWCRRVPGRPMPGFARVGWDASGSTCRTSAGSSQGPAGGAELIWDTRSPAYRGALRPFRATHEADPAHFGVFHGLSLRDSPTPALGSHRVALTPGASRPPPAVLPPRCPPSGPFPPCPPPASSATALPAEPLGGAGRGRSSPE